MDGANKLLWSSLRSAEEAREADKKQRFAAAALEREAEAKRLREKNEARAKAQSASAAPTPSNEATEEEILSSFFCTLKETPPAPAPAAAASVEVANAKPTGPPNASLPPSPPPVSTPNVTGAGDKDIGK